jgi:arylsulfatase
VDLQVQLVLKELDDLGLTGRTIVVFTSDHGEMGGAHGGMRGKGPTPYEECIHLPFVIAHPDVPGGQDCHALTSHMDIAPTFASLAGSTASQVSERAGRELPGKDISKLLGDPSAATPNELREGALFTYSGLAMVDSDPLRHTLELIQQGTPFAEAMAHGGKPDLRKRGSLRTIVDARHKFTRYFSPMQHNTPTSIDELYRYNDVELFDLEDDPREMRNLAVEPEANEELLMTMNAKLSALVKAEIGEDDGHELPHMEGISWEVRPTGDAIVLD